MTIALKVITLILSAAILILSFAGAYSLLVYIYGDKNPKKWKSILFSKTDNFKNVFLPNKGKGEKSDTDLKK